jgi:hypothetical protein
MEKNKRKRKAFFPMRTFTRPELDDTLFTLFTEKLKEAYFKQDPEVITRFILSMIVLANLPLSFVEHFVFKTFLALVVPWYDVPSRTTVLFCFSALNIFL